MRPAEADVGHDARSQLGQAAQLNVESVDCLEPVLEVAANALMASVRAGVRGVFDRLPDDLLGEEVEPGIEASDLGHAVRFGEDLADQLCVGTLAHPPNLLRGLALTVWFLAAHIRAPASAWLRQSLRDVGVRLRSTRASAGQLESHGCLQGQRPVFVPPDVPPARRLGSGSGFAV
jgi:hypothetical protein